MLLKEKDLTAGEIANYINMTKPSIFHHLNILKQAELVTDERKGQNIYYSLNTTVLEQVINWLFNVVYFNEGEIKNDKNK